MSGFTDEEIFLNSLGRESFLRFWSWPNLFRDQGDSNRNGDGKEICDLTIVFENDVILFSDKRIEFNVNKEIKVAWPRWAKKAIGDSVKQIKGARRWFEEFPERIFVDKKCKHKIPVKIPERDKIKFHNIVVCHGVEEVLASFNREASFMFVDWPLYFQTLFIALPITGSPPQIFPWRTISQCTVRMPFVVMF
ncbi:hypothetical protein SMD67_25105, partial [Klebsiella michiganensis]|nr:hypothetical protein [Klebsiella michiganensis]MDV6974193.1 hypothetical protein [Klebsiella michiganensis]MDW5483705.1 hypothetical protein [Klebsiella michiganensis]MDW5497564.1 hypothetical protein [Klebsiella michiganensis]MDZ5709724.1 hypothetical protein [Klebsiella michiganensis]